MEKRNLTCIGCPMGCQITVEFEGEEKDKIFQCMDEINKVRAHAPLKIGDVVVKDVCGTGVDVVVTKNCDIA